MDLKEKIIYAIATLELIAFVSGTLYSFNNINKLVDNQTKVVYREDLKKKALDGAGIALLGLTGAVLRNVYSLNPNETSSE